MAIQESGEMYLETILVLSQEKPEVHAVDVGEKLGFSKPSVSRAVGILQSQGYITVEPSYALKLTDSGRAIAEKIYERHTVLSELLTNLGVPHEIAVEDACRMEHVISDETFAAIQNHIRMVRNHELPKL